MTGQETKIESQDNLPHGRSAKTTVWVNSSYFAEGLPYWIVRFIMTVFFTDVGVRELYLGFINFLGIPWNLKFLWAPLVDLYSTKRRWMLIIQLTIAATITCVAVLSLWTLPGAPVPARILDFIAFLGLGLAFISSTHDISIDAYYLAALTNKSDQALYTGDRVLSYRIATIYARSVLVAAAAVVGWATTWGIAALTMLILYLFHSWYLPQPEVSATRADNSIRQVARRFLEAFRTYLDQPRVAVMLAFIVTFKMGDDILLSMYTPFLMRYLGVTKLQLSWVTGILGTTGMIIGSLMSAWWISKVGLKRALWPLALLMNINILAYVGLAYWKPDPTTTSGIAWIAGLNMYEQWAMGLGNAVLLVYLLRTCRPEHKAAHYAVGSAFMSLTLTLFGGFSGMIVEAIGYVWLFLIGFFVSIPSMMLILWIPHLDDQPK